ncbi:MULTISPECIES: hypothetical protein [unclassified Dyella]|uniref:hypothetical protein n=1 Tax=unclassified Dyella TaxID=2634549 RepID=UPI000CC45231|nr:MULTISPECIES: hypothetical protein [unclassified Dyella]MDR3445370.1 hypothetical protein [Dyella sp.]PMQ07015.1 hypothetical protein DyAD56_02390 [Dyella sp. AD56]
MTRRTNAWLLALLLVGVVHTAHSASLQRFDNFRVQNVYQGQVAAPMLRSAQDKRYRTMIRDAAASEKVNFAGHYVLSAVGCGGGCLQIFALDARNGEVSWLPFTVSWGVEDKLFDTEIMPLDYRIDSNLLVVAGSRNEHGHGTYNYIFEHGHFRLLDAHEDPPNGLWP